MQIVFGGVEGDISDEQFCAHLLISCLLYCFRLSPVTGFQSSLNGVHLKISMLERSFLLTDLVIILNCPKMTSEIVANPTLAIPNQNLLKGGGEVMEKAEKLLFWQNVFLKGLFC